MPLRLPTRGRLGSAAELATGGRLPGGATPLSAAVYSAWTDWLCPYCGGPVARWNLGDVPRGYCRECARAWGTPRATEGRTYGRSVSLPARPNQRWEHRAVALTPTGGFTNRVRYHWRPDLYEETDEYLRGDGPGMNTNAPRWWARHPHEILDGQGLGTWDGDRVPPYRPGWDLPRLGEMMGRPLGLAQLKLAFPPEWIAPQDFTLEVDCEREDGEVETLPVRVPRGTQGPTELRPLGEVIALSAAVKLRAETLSSPYPTMGLYKAVRDIRLVEPESAPGCRCVVTADVPYLATPRGPVVRGLAAEFMALQLLPPGSRPHILEDGVGELFLFRVREGSIEMRRRRSLGLPWDPPRLITQGGEDDYPWAAKDERGRMILVRQTGEGYTVVAHSVDDGRTWEEL